MKHTLVLILVFLSREGIAQSLNVGLRGGAGYYMQYKHSPGKKFEALNGQHMALQPEIFMRYCTKSRWAFEGAVNMNNLKFVENYDDYVCGPGITHESYNYTNISNWEGFVTIQYDISCKHLQRNALLKRLHSYAGISVGGVRSYSTDNYSGDGTGLNIDNHPQSVSSEFWTGLSHTLTYNLSKRFSVTSVAQVQIAPFRFFSRYAGSYFYSPIAKASFQIGGCYRL